MYFIMNPSKYLRGRRGYQSKVECDKYLDYDFVAQATSAGMGIEFFTFR